MHIVELDDKSLRSLRVMLVLTDAEDAALLGRANPRQSLIVSVLMTVFFCQANSYEAEVCVSASFMGH